MIMHEKVKLISVVTHTVWMNVSRIPVAKGLGGSKQHGRPFVFRPWLTWPFGIIWLAIGPRCSDPTERFLGVGWGKAALVYSPCSKTHSSDLTDAASLPLCTAFSTEKGLSFWGRAIGQGQQAPNLPS